MVQKGKKTNNSAAKSRLRWVLPFCLGAIVALGFCRVVPVGQLLFAAGGYQSDVSELRNISDLLSLSTAELEKVDVALVNLLCAEGLNGSENLDVAECLSTLDDWADQIAKDTELRMQSYYRNPAKYDNSPNFFKLVNMILTLKNNIGVDYNPAIMERTTFPDLKDVFLHGCLAGKKEGGCISIPTLCVAVGRRLGYPLRLITTREHVFFRWDDGKEAFNMEACCPGCDTHTDDHYKNWPHRLTNADIKMGAYLRSLTPGEELALFLETRGHCLYDAGEINEALVCYSQAYKLMPDSVDKYASIHRCVEHERRKFEKINKSLTSPQGRM